MRAPAVTYIPGPRSCVVMWLTFYYNSVCSLIWNTFDLSCIRMYSSSDTSKDVLGRGQGGYEPSLGLDVSTRTVPL